MAEQISKTHTQIVADIEDKLRVNDWTGRIGFILALTLGVVLIPMVWLGKFGNEGTIVMGLVCLFMLGFGAYGLWDSRRPKPNGFMLLVRDEPERIVWWYTVEIYSNTVHTYDDVFLCRDDGAQAAMRFSAAYLKVHGDSFAALFPHAMRGFTEERKQLFAENPALPRQA